MSRKENIKALEKLIEEHTYPCRACLDEVSELATAIYDSIYLDEEELMGSLARGYCTKRNEKKIVDPDLIEDMVEDIKSKNVIRIKEDNQ